MLLLHLYKEVVSRMHAWVGNISCCTSNNFNFKFFIIIDSNTNKIRCDQILFNVNKYEENE